MGVMSYRIKENFVCTVHLHPFIHPFVHPSGALEWLTGLSGRTDNQTDKQIEGQANLHTDSPCILQDVTPFGDAAKKKRASQRTNILWFVHFDRVIEKNHSGSQDKCIACCFYGVVRKKLFLFDIDEKNFAVSK